MILLDTHAWIWHLADRSLLSETARSEIDRVSESRRTETIHVSAISVWELFMLVKKGRLVLSVPPAAFVTRTRQDPKMSIVTVDDAIGRRSVELPDHHADPTDRIILATAVERGLSIVTRDSMFRTYTVAPVVW
jgi:PIN domain nuclease of toxin-antitoxin system